METSLNLVGDRIHFSCLKNIYSMSEQIILVEYSCFTNKNEDSIFLVRVGRLRDVCLQVLGGGVTAR